MGQQQTWRLAWALSALPLKADKAQTCWHVRLCHKRTNALQQTTVGLAVELGSHFEEIRDCDPIQDAFRALQQFREPAIIIGLDTDTELHAKLARVRDDAFTERLARSVVSGKSAVDVIVIRKRLRQRLRLCTRFGDAKTDVRTWRRGRIAHQYEAAENQAGRAEIINRCEERLIDVPHTIEVLRGSRVSASVCICAIKSLRTSGGGTPNSYSRP